MKCFKRISIIFPFFYIWSIQLVFGGTGSFFPFFSVFRSFLLATSSFSFLLKVWNCKTTSVKLTVLDVFCVADSTYVSCELIFSIAYVCFCFLVSCSFLSFLYLWWINTIYYSIKETIRFFIKFSEYRLALAYNFDVFYGILSFIKSS